MGEFVYIFSNRSHPGWVKVGWTARSVEDRRRELSSATGVIEPFKCERVFEVPDGAGEYAESLAHNALVSFRRVKEHFACNVKAAGDLVDKALADIGGLHFNVREAHRKIRNSQTVIAAESARLTAIRQERAVELMKLDQLRYKRLNDVAGLLGSQFRVRILVSWLLLVVGIIATGYALYLYAGGWFLASVLVVAPFRVAKRLFPLFAVDMNEYRIQSAVIESEISAEIATKSAELKAMADLAKKRVGEAQSTREEMRASLRHLKVPLPSRRHRRRASR
jgi:hypothetical protein